jgi:type IV pilus assembly protein PilE
MDLKGGFDKGLTLIELLVVVAIVGILAAIALPTYTGFMQRGRRGDAKTALEQIRAAEEVRRAERGSYTNDLAALRTSFGGPAATAGDYNLSFVAANANSFTAQAVPFTARQIPDGNLFINNNGDKWPADRWRR